MVYVMGYTEDEILLAEAERHNGEDYSSMYFIEPENIIIDINWVFYDRDYYIDTYIENDETVEEFDTLSEAEHELINRVFD